VQAYKRKEISNDKSVKMIKYCLVIIRRRSCPRCC
jgi:hypothetical protein